MTIILIPAFLLIIGILIANITFNIKDTSSSSYTFFLNVCTYYGLSLMFSAVGSLVISIYWWLKESIWTTISPTFIINKLEEGSFLRETLLSETSWKGVQKINEWYMQQNIGWTLIVTLIIFLAILFVSGEETRKKIIEEYEKY